MSFAKKIDFLMNITKTSNSALAHFVKIDPSYISRLRNGKRLMPKDKHIIQNMAIYLSRQIKEDYQKKALIDALKITSVPEDKNLLVDEITNWITSNSDEKMSQVSQFLHSLSTANSRIVKFENSSEFSGYFPNKAVSIYYGVEGKRKAAEYFLTEIATCETPQTILLFSDEGTEWMTGNPNFANKWALLMLNVLSRGNRIKIIHTLSRDLDEMLSAINQWMPMYMSGLIEPYFYPKKRDGIFKHTFFIAPETAAVISNSIGEHIYTAANVLYRDKDVVSSFTTQFNQYLRLCRPLMQIFTTSEKIDCYNTLAKFEQEQTNSIIKTESLSLLTLPKALLTEILKRSDTDINDLETLHDSRYSYFLENLLQNNFTEIISLPDFEAIIKEQVQVSVSDMLNGNPIYYKPDEYISHLEQIISLLEIYDNYHIHIVNNLKKEHNAIYVKEDLGVIIAKNSQPPVVLALNEANITAAFWDFLKNIIGQKSHIPDKKDEYISLLRCYIADLKNFILSHNTRS